MLLKLTFLGLGVVFFFFEFITVTAPALLSVAVGKQHVTFWRFYGDAILC